MWARVNIVVILQWLLYCDIHCLLYLPLRLYKSVHFLLFTCTIITVYCCSRLSVVAVVDLSKPEEIWNTLEVFIKQVKGG